MKTMISRSTYQANAALPQGENLLPQFRDPTHDTVVDVKSNEDKVPEEYTRLMGLDCGKRLLPYTLLDKYDRNRTMQQLPAIIMENDYLKATFLPELGFRLISLWDKKDDKELLFANTSIQVANLSTRNAWFAGGIEWNIGQYGHGFSSMASIHATTQVSEQGDKFLRIYDYERCKGIWWHIDFHLPEDSRFLYAHVVAENRTSERTSMYYWTNGAVYLTDATRIFCSNEHALYLDPYAPKRSRNYGYMTMPTLPIYPEVDASYPNTIPYSDEYFFTCNHDAMPWEAAIDSESGKGYFEASTPLLAYRKMFCWGVGQGGKHWQRFLCPDSTTDYVEIQAGLAPSQTHGMYLEGGETLRWTQAFGALNCKPNEVQKVYETAQKHVSSDVEAIITSDTLSKMHAFFVDDEKVAAGETIQQSNGWGYLESKEQSVQLPSTYRFDAPDSSAPEYVWKEFLENGTLPLVSGSDVYLYPIPDATWEKRIKLAYEAQADSRQKAVLAYYLGVLMLEKEQVVSARDLFQYCFDQDKNEFAARNIAQLELRRDDPSCALDWFETSYGLAQGAYRIKIAEEYLTALVDHHADQKALSFYSTLPETFVQESDTIALERAVLASHLDDPDTVQTLSIDRELCNIREGDTPLNDLWHRYCIQKWGKWCPLIEQMDFNLYQ